MTNDIRMHRENATFSLRTAAILCRDGMLLAQHEPGKNIYAIPGGTVKLCETTEAALIRELREEIGIDAAIERLLWVEESFWTDGGRTQHSICFYYLIDVPNNTSLPALNASIPQRDNAGILLSWLPIAQLDKVTIYPEFLASEIARLDGSVRHFVTRA